MAEVPSAGFASLSVAIDRLEKRFLDGHLTAVTLAVSEDEHIDVSAYLVLAHAAIEGYLETVAQWVLENAVDNWTKVQRLSRATACLLLECKFDRKLREHEVFNRIRKALDSAKSTMSKVINVDNHGISVGHVKELFCPLGLDLPDDPSSLASLDKLAKRRGEKAHKGVGATVVVAAGDAKKMVGDCLVVAKQIGVTAEGLQV